MSHAQSAVRLFKLRLDALRKALLFVANPGQQTSCDGRDPCSTCSTAGEDCTYGPKTAPKSRTDIMLDVVLRSERLLREISTKLDPQYSPQRGFHANGGRLQLFVDGTLGGDAASSTTVISSPLTESNHRQSDIAQSISNAILSPYHALTTESILAWPHFDRFRSLRTNYSFSVFDLENSRPPFPQLPSPVQPYLSRNDIERTVESFSLNVNFWHPTMLRAKLNTLKEIIISGRLDDSTTSCLALLVMALGSASTMVASLAKYNDPTAAEMNDRSQSKVTSELFFDNALKRIHVAQMECTVDAAHSLLLVADYLAELSALPQSGISDIESSVSLPTDFDTHESPLDKEKSSLYFLACISMRRLLNRVHSLLYAKDTGASFNDAQFPSVVSELDHQLEQWREFLPPDFQFNIDLSPAPNAQSGFLRQRYLTCRSVIYQPYLNWALSNSGAATEWLPRDVYENCKRCLTACWMHGLTVEAFPHKVMLDTWMCSLSMASSVLVLLAASQITALQACLRPMSGEIGPHLETLLRSWMHIPGHGVSPSVKRSIELIREASHSITEILGE
ncbi:hypothetical protein FQN53_008831 [Emmonsiellopsis sp. PD_33]|nr:hypothetical protein FQN53_008831 [Emmonsiellopsis sp. PD_33]